MTYIALMPGQHIELRAKRGATPAQAIHEAITFCIETSTLICDLHYNGFLFAIESDSDVNQLVREYRAWEEWNKSNEDC